MLSIFILATALIFTNINGNKIEVHRLFHPSNIDHLYTTNKQEGTKVGYRYESIAFKLDSELSLLEDVPKALLHRYYNSRLNDHFYTTDINEVGIPSKQDIIDGTYNNRIGEEDKFGFRYEGTLNNGYCYHNGKDSDGNVIDLSTSQFLIPLYRCYKSGGDHLYTTNINEVNIATRKQGYKYEGIECYVYPSDFKTPSPTQHPVELSSPDNNVYLNLVRPAAAAGSDSNGYYILNIGEISAYDKNNNKLELIVDSFESQHRFHNVVKSIDGNINTFGHSLVRMNAVDTWFKYKINGINDVCDLSKVVVDNRGDCCSNRIVGSYLQVLTNSTVISTNNFESNQARYQFNYICLNC